VQFTKESVIEAMPERIWAFHELPCALERLTPPWEPVRVIRKAQGLQVGSRVVIETKLFGIVKARWIAEHTRYEPPRMFEDVQVSGPFKAWRHRHTIEPHAAGALLRDEIEYEPPFGFLGKAFAPLLVLPRLERMFEYRHRVTKAWCEEQG
jgi:hypothetical protein